MNSGNASWNWNGAGSEAIPPAPDALQQRPVQVIQMDWKDILGSQGGAPVTSSTSPFVLPRNVSLGQGQQPQGFYSGYGMRQGVAEGQPPATFRIAVGNPGEGFWNPGSGGGQSSSAAGGDWNRGAGKNFQGGSMALGASVAVETPRCYEPCGNCEACKSKQTRGSSGSSKGGKAKNFLCRQSPAPKPTK